MAEQKPALPYSPDDMKRRKRRAQLMALGLGLLVIIFFITTIVRLGSHVADKVL